jgi:HTH-type transcriptional regulator, sugar sensing transcriptional regulator
MNMPPEDPVRLVECLKSLGITKYEALVYIALLRVPSATASEIHESSGVPRASVYPVLDQLLEKDLVSVSQSAPKRFAAIPSGEAINRLVSRIDSDAEFARNSLLAIHHQRLSNEQGSEELIWNLYGIDAIRKRLIDLIVGATREIRIITHPNVLSEEIMTMLANASHRIQVETVIARWDQATGKNLKISINQHSEIFHGSAEANELMAGGICITDGARVLVIVGSGDTDSVALFSESEGFVRFFSRYYDLVIERAKKNG